MIQQFKAILLRDFQAREAGTVIDVMSGGEGFGGRWLALAPVALAGQWLVPLTDADAALTMKEAAHVLSVRRGRPVPASSVVRYIKKGTLKHGGRPHPAAAPARGNPLFVARQSVWDMQFPPHSGHRPTKLTTR